MRILYVLNSASMDGASISFLNMLKGIRPKGFECYVVIPKKSMINQKFIDILVSLSVPYYIIPVYFSICYTKITGLRKLKQYIKKYLGITCFYKIISYEILYRLIKKIKPDIVHTNVGIIHEPFLICKKMGIRHIWHLREYQILDFSWNILPSFDHYCKMLRESEVITITNDIRKYFCLESSSNACTIYNGIFDKRDARLVFPKEKYFLCASRVSEEKGYYDVINAFAAFYNENRDYKLLIAGYGCEKYLTYLKTLSKKLSCDDAVVFLGYCDDVRSLMYRAKALIVASYYEGFGRMTAEALFCGCLVIGRSTGGTKEILEYTGGLMFGGGFEELKQKMNEIVLMSENNYRSIVSECQNRAVLKFSNEAYVENVCKLYKRGEL